MSVRSVRDHGRLVGIREHGLEPARQSQEHRRVAAVEVQLQEATVSVGLRQGRYEHSRHLRPDHRRGQFLVARHAHEQCDGVLGRRRGDDPTPAPVDALAHEVIRDVRGRVGVTVERAGTRCCYCVEPVHYLDEGEVLASVLVATQTPNQLLLDYGVAALVGIGAERSVALLLVVEEVEVRSVRRAVSTAHDRRVARRGRRRCGRTHRAGRDERQCDQATQAEQKPGRREAKTHVSVPRSFRWRARRRPGGHLRRSARSRSAA